MHYFSPQLIPFYFQNINLFTTLKIAFYAKIAFFYDCSKKIEKLRHVKNITHYQYILKWDNERMDFNQKVMHGIWKRV